MRQRLPSQPLSGSSLREANGGRPLPTAGEQERQLSTRHTGSGADKDSTGLARVPCGCDRPRVTLKDCGRLGPVELAQTPETTSPATRAQF